jgi:acyl-[acyl-carrier-protein]-phospholipid O-acyltransferase / long-chain-fatty-acid--[acyl-carrier-protein] ligase
VPVGEEGLLWISGPNVMQGYLDRPDLTAKVVQDGWYCTGDIAKIDADGFITITGRESRFSKIGGEMVPHIAIEEAVNPNSARPMANCWRSWPPWRTRGKGSGSSCSICPRPADPRMSVAVWPRAGLPNLWIPAPDSFAEIEEMPVLGTGKLE